MNIIKNKSRKIARKKTFVLLWNAVLLGNVDYGTQESVAYQNQSEQEY